MPSLVAVAAEQLTHQPPIQCRYNNKPPRLSVFLYFPQGFSAHSGIEAKFRLYISFYNGVLSVRLYHPVSSSRASVYRDFKTPFFQKKVKKKDIFLHYILFYFSLILSLFH